MLGYHRVGASDWDPLELCIDAARFEAQLDAIGRDRVFLPLSELAARQAAGEPLAGAAALTFDDGYRDFASVALGILQRKGVPATVFVATGFSGRHFWWEEIAASLRPGRGPDSLAIRLPGGTERRYGGLQTPDGAAAAVREICDRLACRTPPEIDTVLDQLRAPGDAARSPPAQAMPLGRDELRRLGMEDVVELGAHTVSHGCLAKLDPDTQRDEILGSRNDLQDITGTAITSFSYPNGSYSRVTPGILRELGFRQACNSNQALYTRRSDPLLMPRLWPPDADGSAFQGWLGQWTRLDP